jgi:hypothetical protein
MCIIVNRIPRSGWKKIERRHALDPSYGAEQEPFQGWIAA